MISQDTILLFTQRGTRGFYSRSTNGGTEFSPYVVIDSLVDPLRCVVTNGRRAVFYGRYREPNSLPAPTLRWISDSSLNLSDTVALTARPVTQGLGDGGARKNFLVYTSADSSTYVTCCYGLRDSSPVLSDSSFFFVTMFAKSACVTIRSLRCCSKVMPYTSRVSIGSGS